jgi:hypothetical protein
MAFSPSIFNGSPANHSGSNGSPPSLSRLRQALPAVRAIGEFSGSCNTWESTEGLVIGGEHTMPPQT